MPRPIRGVCLNTLPHPQTAAPPASPVQRLRRIRVPARLPCKLGAVSFLQGVYLLAACGLQQLLGRTDSSKGRPVILWPWLLGCHAEARVQSSKLLRRAPEHAACGVQCEAYTAANRAHEVFHSPAGKAVQLPAAVV